MQMADMIFDGNPSFFDADYFERGLETGKSCYQVYRWIPELTIPMAMTIIDYLGIKRGQKVLDFGCSKGFLVKALRMLGRDAWGFDVSQYAIENADPTIRDYCKLMGTENGTPEQFHFCVAKDVLEHIPEAVLAVTLQEIRATTLFAVIPLGENGTYRAPANNIDKSHVVCRPEAWWVDKFEACGWKAVWFTWRVPGIKDSYYDNFPTAHGFFTLKR